MSPFLFILRHLQLIMNSSKYPLATVEALLEAFGINIGGGYDIGCKFGITLGRSPLGRQAKNLNYKALVGSFHGHAHNRLCQLGFLMSRAWAWKILRAVNVSFPNQMPLLPRFATLGFLITSKRLLNSQNTWTRMKHIRT